MEKSKEEEKVLKLEETQEFEIFSLKIKNTECKAIYEVLTIKESIFENFITGQVTILDTNSLIEQIPIIGEEEVHIEIGLESDAPEKEKIKYSFHIYKIDNRTREGVGQTIEEYIIYFCDKIALNDKLSRVSKTYKEKPISSYVNEIFKKELKGEQIEVEETEDNFEINIPNLNPISSINFLTNFSYNSYQGEKNLFYLFYQDREKFHYKSVEKMINGKKNLEIRFEIHDSYEEYKAKGKSGNKETEEGSGGFMSIFSEIINYFFEPDLSPPEVKEEDIITAESYEILKSFSNYESAETGYFGFTNYSSDILSKTLHKIQYKYSDDFNKMAKLSKVETKTNKYQISEEPFFTKIYSKPTTKGRLDSEYVEETLGKQIEHYTEERDPLKNTKKERFFMGPKFIVVLPGNSKIKLGEISYLKFPSYKTNEERSRKYPDDEIYSGNYLIFEIVHTFTQLNKWTCTTSYVSDSIKKNS